jgi:Tfp pilus assembly protein PilV
VKCVRLLRVRRGFSLAETFVSVLLVGVSLAASMQTVGAVLRQRSSTNDDTVAALLAQQLLSEILSQSYEEPVDAVSFGPEGVEENREDFDDVDDYNAWIETPPTDQDGTALDGLTGWSREVSVEQVAASDALVASVQVGSDEVGVGLRSPNATDSGVKRITVTVKRNGTAVSSLVGLRTDVWPGTE